MKLSTLIAVPLVLMAQGYTLVITHTNGTKTEIPTDEIANMSFESERQDPNPSALSTPRVVVTKSQPDTYDLSWSSVEGASYYGWTLDGDSKLLTTTGYQCTIGDLTVGDHEVSLRAYPASGSGFVESEPAVVKLSAELIMRINVLAKDKTSANVTVSVNADEPCVVGIVPASVIGASGQISYVNGNADAQRMVFDAVPGTAQSVTFNGLAPDTDYNVVAFLSGSTDRVFANSFRTNADLNPGDRASVFPPGVSAESGWIDVDKVGNLASYGWSGEDNKMCWACQVSGMLQWWLNDYKAKTGRDFQTAYPIPTESKCYSTPIMDLLVDYYPHAAGLSFKPFKWFFTGVPYNEWHENGDKMYNESLPYWKGGFGGMTEDEAQSLMVVNEKSSDGYTIPEYEFNRRVDIQGKSEAETIRIFSDRIINALRQGPVAVSLVTSGGSNVHAVSCWGADYEVLSDGSFKVNKLYIAENDPVPGNVRNGLNDGTVTYSGDYVQLEMSTTNGKRNLNLFFGLRGYQGE